VWGWILKEFNQPVKAPWAIRVFLKTNIAKYLPGNVWHFYGRVWAARKAGISLEAAILSVVLEPLLMAASALLIALIGRVGKHTDKLAIELVASTQGKTDCKAILLG
jgi:hypothetical protein